MTAFAKADTEDEASRPLDRLPTILATGQPNPYEGLPADDNDLDLTVKDDQAWSPREPSQTRFGLQRLLY